MKAEQTRNGLDLEIDGGDTDDDDGGCRNTWKQHVVRMVKEIIHRVVKQVDQGHSDNKSFTRSEQAMP